MRPFCNSMTYFFPCRGINCITLRVTRHISLNQFPICLRKTIRFLHYPHFTIFLGLSRLCQTHNPLVSFCPVFLIDSCCFRSHLRLYFATAAVTLLTAKNSTESPFVVKHFKVPSHVVFHIKVGRILLSLLFSHCY